MSNEDESSEKSHEPSQRKLEEARKKGEVARAPDLHTASIYTGFLACSFVIGQDLLFGFADTILPLIERPDQISDSFFRNSASASSGALISGVLRNTMAIFITPILFLAIVLTVTRSFTVTLNKLKPKLTRLSIISNTKNKFGTRGLFEFAKSFVKLGLYAFVLSFFLIQDIDQIVGSIHKPSRIIVVLIFNSFLKLALLAVIISISLGVLDFAWQWSQHMKKNRMTQKELRDELKDAEGDPYLKQHRRSRAQEIALNQMMTEARKADVIIVNPTHFAVALSWSRLAGSAPRVSAKGCDEIAARIRQIATDNQIPIYSDPPTARAIYASTEIGDEIDHSVYEPVAAAIRFADKMRKKSRSLPT